MFFLNTKIFNKNFCHMCLTEILLHFQIQKYSKNVNSEIKCILDTYLTDILFYFAFQYII